MRSEKAPQPEELIINVFMQLNEAKQEPNRYVM